MHVIKEGDNKIYRDIPIEKKTNGIVRFQNLPLISKNKVGTTSFLLDIKLEALQASTEALELVSLQNR